MAAKNPERLFGMKKVPTAAKFAKAKIEPTDDSAAQDDDG